MAKKWMDKAFKNAHGQFRAKAERAGMGTVAFARHVQGNDRYSTKTRRQAALVMNARKRRSK